MKKKGSAIIAVLACITVLAVLAFAFIGSSREKKSISRLMSDDKKCEALAESANDFIIQYIKKNANNHDQSNNTMSSIYYLLRAPLKVKTAGSDGTNHNLDVSDTKELELETLVPYENVLNPTIDDIGWTGKVTIKSVCELCKAESFTPYSDGYLVPTIDIEHLAAMGDSAKFLDDINANFTFDKSGWQPSDWHLQIKFPEGNPTEESVTYDLVFDLGWLNSIPGIEDIDLPDISIKVSRDKEDTIEFEVCIDLQPLKDITILGGHPFKSLAEGLENLTTFKVDLQDFINKFHNFFPDIPEKTLPGLQDAYTIGEPKYDFSSYADENISGKFSEIENGYQQCLNTFSLNSSCDFGAESYYLEKGGILRITTTVEYKKDANKTIEKTLVSEIPFKASDVQPMAPEYTFFVSNSTNVNPDDDTVVVSGEPGTTGQLGDPIEFNLLDGSEKAFYSESSAPIPYGSFIIHNVPAKMESTAVASIIKNKINFDGLDNKHIPGMVRINSQYPGNKNNGVTQIRSFFGLIAQPELTEFNKFFTPFDLITSTNKNNKFNSIVSFCWQENEESESTTAQRYHDLELPVIFEEDNTGKELFGKGVKNVISFLKSSNFAIVSVPTMLYGTCHMEYPLGIAVEGPVESVFSRTRVYVKPTGKIGFISFEEASELYLCYEKVVNTSSDGKAYAFDGSDSKDKGNRDSERAVPYGMQGFKGYGESWNSNDDYQYSPANCYDALQYSKKATKYYETAEEFDQALGIEVENGGLASGGYLFLNGVYYIKSGDITLGETKYKGNGLIVNKSGIIKITGSITRDDEESTLGIIARGSAISFETDKVIQAACFSCNAPTVSGNLNLYGNLVCNNFKRDDIGNNANIYYDNTICTVTPLASHRKVGKFEPKRYAVAFSDNWSKFSYEQKKDNQ